MLRLSIKHCCFLLLLLCSMASAVNAADQYPFDPKEDAPKLAPTVLVETTKGSFEIAFYPDAAPLTVRSFQYLAKKGFYDNLAFHRHVPGFAIQGGDPKGDGKGGPGYTLPPEYSSIPHVRGTLGMARLASEVNPERRSNGSQFYITLAPSPHLDGLYTVFGQVVAGMDNVEKLREGDKIIRVRFPRQ